MLNANASDLLPLRRWSEQWLRAKTGELVSGPSMSPENRFRTADGVVAHVTMGPAMDQQIIAELFDNVLEAAAELAAGALDALGNSRELPALRGVEDDDTIRLAQITLADD